MTLKFIQLRRNSMNFFKNLFSDPVIPARAGCGEICDAICEAGSAPATKGGEIGTQASSGKSL